MTSSYTDAQGNTRPLPVATRDVVVHDDALGIDRQLYAGQPVPPELIDAYEAKVGSASSADRAAADRDDAPDYESMKVEDLQGLADQRGLTVEGSGKDGNVVKADLVKALSGS